MYYITYSHFSAYNNEIITTKACGTKEEASATIKKINNTEGYEFLSVEYKEGNKDDER